MNFQIYFREDYYADDRRDYGNQRTNLSASNIIEVKKRFHELFENCSIVDVVELPY